MVRAVYAPNVAEPLDVQVEMIGGEGRIREEALVLGEWPAFLSNHVTYRYGR
jgi:hypothetical protein